MTGSHLFKFLSLKGIAILVGIALILSLIVTFVIIPQQKTKAAAPGIESHQINPFIGANGYINPDYASEVTKAANAKGGTFGAQMATVANYPTAVWMDRMAAITGTVAARGLAAHLDAALAQQNSSGSRVVATFVIYDLPGRDCAARSSNGELAVGQLSTYQSSYIDPIASILANPKYAALRIALVIEPDSLGNVVTNMSMQTCSASAAGYEAGIEYALNKFHPIANVYQYMDIGHSGWLGWPNNFSAAVQEFTKVTKATNAGLGSLDGFISNTANYTPVTEPFFTGNTMVGGQPVKSANFYQYDPYVDEATYDTDMYTALVRAGFSPNIGMLIDTSRNGWGGSSRPAAASTSTDVNTFVNASRIDRRLDRGAWCNQKGSGIGQVPQANPAQHLYAYVWIKPPGESDGGSDPTAPRYDSNCGATGTDTNGLPVNGLTPAPQAGQWFEAEFEMLVQNSYPVLGSATSPTSTPTSNGPTNTPVAATPTNTPVIATPTNTPVTKTGWNTGLHVSGNKIVNSAGQNLQLLGVNRSGAEYMCINSTNTGFFDGPTNDQTSVNAIKSWHANTVRLPINEDCWLGINGEPAFSNSAAYQQALTSYVNLLTANGMVVIVDLHWNYGGTTQSTGQQPMADRDHAPAFWTSVATALKSNSAVIFDLYNEPHDISWTCWRDGGAGCGAPFTVAGFQELDNAVRATGATNIVMLGGLAWSNDLSQWAAFKPTDATGNVAISWHNYNFNACSNTSCWNSVEAPLMQQYPLITGEMGENDCAHGYIDTLMPWLDAHGGNYLGWAWNTWSCTSGPGLITDYSGTPTGFGVGLRDHFATLTSAPTPTPTNPTPTPTRPSNPTPTPTQRPQATNTPLPGTTPTPTHVATPTPTTGSGGVSLKAQYKVGDPGAPNDNQIKPYLKIFNTGTTTISLSDVTVRYWYTEDGTQAQSYFCDYATLGCANINGTFVRLSTAKTNADTYLQIGFGSGAGTLAPGANTNELQNRFSKSDWSNYNESNDYSYNASDTNYTDWNRVTVYYKGLLVWGTEP